MKWLALSAFLAAVFGCSSSTTPGAGEVKPLPAKRIPPGSKQPGAPAPDQKPNP